MKNYQKRIKAKQIKLQKTDAGVEVSEEVYAPDGAKSFQTALVVRDAEHLQQLQAEAEQNLADYKATTETTTKELEDRVSGLKAMAADIKKLTEI